MNYFKHMSLKAKMIGVIALTILLVGGGGLASVMMLVQSYKNSVSLKMQGVAQGIGDKFAAQLYERYGDVQAFALNETIKKMNPREIAPILDQYVALYGIYDLILVVDRDGNPVASNLKDAAGKPVDVKSLRELNYSEFEWFKSVMAGKTTDDKEANLSGTYIEDFAADTLFKVAFNELRYGSSFSSAIRDSNGQIIGVITNRAGSRWFEQEVVSTNHELESLGVNSAHLLVTNSKGHVIVNYCPSENGGSLDVVHDPKTILKRDVVKEGWQPAVAASSKDLGVIVATDLENPDESEVSGFHKINNGKWIKSLGWTSFASVSTDEAYKEIDKTIRSFAILFAICLLVSIFIGVMVSFSVSRVVAGVTETLAVNAKDVQLAAGTIASSSTQLFDAAQEQAAALQQTVAAVDEISAMVEKNADAATRSKDVSAQSRDAAERGRGIVENMIQAIQDIDGANEEISSQMSESNRELNEITTLINDIGSKTKVINEIVFQTKLLSFNASVEAARAGEYGKGFAVVAEEVGNLAEMSGSAAKEISSLLETSVRKVEAIVDQTKTRVDRLTSLAKDKVKTGSAVANECSSALGEIIENVQSVDSLVSEIAVASNEQSTGIREISKAVGQLEQVTQKNSVVAQSSSSAATQLTGQSSQLNSLVQDLREVVTGERESQADNEREVRGREENLKAAVLKFPKKKSKPIEADDTDGSASMKIASSDSTPSANDPGFD